MMKKRLLANIGGLPVQQCCYSSFRLVLFVVLSISSLLVHADEFRARIVKVQGEVYIINSQGEQRSPEKTQFLVNRMDTVVTRDNSKAVVQFNDGAMSVLDEKSSLRVEKTGWLSQLGGRVYYVFRKVFGKKKSRKIKTRFATIGIRGTTFIVYEDGDNKGVALQEGKLNIESPGEAYEIHRQQQADDFEAFKQQAQQRADALKQEYSDYKTDLNKAFVEYKKSFDLEANRVVSFDGNQVKEQDLSDQFKSEFDDFKNFSSDYINAYKELDDMEN